MTKETGVFNRKEMLLMKRPLSKRVPMDRKRRAKQFAPFQALKGFAHSIAETETIYVARKEQSDGMRLEMDRVLKALPEGMPVSLIYFQESEKHPGFGMYLTITGIPKMIAHERILEVGGIPVPIHDIAGIEPLEEE